MKISELVGAGTNKLRVTSVGERFCVVVKIVRCFPARVCGCTRACAQVRGERCECLNAGLFSCVYVRHACVYVYVHQGP